MAVFRKRSKSDSQSEYTCTVRFLDDTESTQLTFKKDTLGQWLFDRVCEKLNLLEKDYFGLRYVDTENQRHWLDPLKTVHKQLKGLNKMVLCFRVKFYPEDPMKLHEEITRYYLFLQLRRDLHHGRLLCALDESIHLAAFIIQSEVGDYDPQDHPPGYITEFKMLPKQTPRHEERIMEAHKALVGEVPSDSESNFLKKAASLDTYGVDPHQVKDQKGDLLYLGVTHLGIMTFRGSRRTQLFKWSQIRRLAYEGKMFIVHHSAAEIHFEEGSNKKKKPLAVGFKCTTAPAAKYLWRSAVEQQLFFTLSSSNTVPKIRSGNSIFSRGSKFRFSGRCQNEAYEASENIHRSEPAFARTSSLPNFGRKSHTLDSKNNTMTNSMLSDSSREEAAVDVPSILVNEPISPSSQTQQLMEGSVIMAPLADHEDEQVVEEVMQVAATTAVSSAPPMKHKENGQVVKDRTGILETSIDDIVTYEPNQTMEESDYDHEEEQQGKKAGLDEQIALLDEEITKPSIAADLNLSSPPTTSKAVETPKKSGGGMCGKALMLSLFISLVIAFVLFYVVFFSNIKHPMVPKLRGNLKFLEPVADFVGKQAKSAAAMFKKK